MISRASAFPIAVASSFETLCFASSQDEVSTLMWRSAGNAARLSHEATGSGSLRAR